MKKIAIGDKRFVITKNLIMMLVMLVVIFIAIFAWYTSSYAVTAETTSISAQAADNVELALPNDDGSFPISNNKWDTNLQFADSGYLKNLVKDITSNGKQFAVPTFEAAKGLKDGRKVIADDVWSDGLSSREALTNESTLDDDQYNYISFDFYIRSKQKDINVTGESFLAAGSETGYQDADHPSPTEDVEERRSEGAKSLVKNDSKSIYRTSSYGAAEGQIGSFSSDAIIGAMRVSLVGAPVDGVEQSGGLYRETTYDGGTWEAKSDLRFLWLPRPDIHLNTDDNSNNWTLTTDINKTNPLAAETYCHQFYYGEYVKNSNDEYILDSDGKKIPKNLTKTIYYDHNVYTPSDITGKSSPNFFFVSNGVKNLSENVSFPSLGQSATVADDAPETSKNIEFIKGTGEKADKDTTGYYVYKYTLNIWIEGEDAEARRSMNNGVFSLELDFGT